MKVTANSFVENPYDRCVFNKIDKSGKQISIILHLDGLMVTSEDQDDLDIFRLDLNRIYPETRTTSGTILQTTKV